MTPDEIPLHIAVPLILTLWGLLFLTVTVGDR